MVYIYTVSNLVIEKKFMMKYKYNYYIIFNKQFLFNYPKKFNTKNSLYFFKSIMTSYFNLINSFLTQTIYLKLYKNDRNPKFLLIFFAAKNSNSLWQIL